MMFSATLSSEVQDLVTRFKVSNMFLLWESACETSAKTAQP